MIKNLMKPLRRLIATIISALMVISVAAPAPAQAQTGGHDPAALIEHLEDAYAYGYGGLLDLRLLNQWLTLSDGTALSVAQLNGVNQLWETIADNDQAPRTGTIDVTALELIYLNLGNIRLPLVGENSLLEILLGDAHVGLLREYAHAPSPYFAHGAAGVVSDSGGIEVTQPGDGRNATVDILSLLHLGSSSVITENIISEAALELGAISAVAKKPDSTGLDENELPPCDDLTRFDYNALGAGDKFGNEEVLQEEHERICSAYQIADAKLVVDSPLVGDLVTTLNTTLGELLTGVESLLNGLLGSSGVLDAIYSIPLVGPLLRGVVDLSLEATIPAQDITTTLLLDPLSDSTGLVSIDLSTGQITVDLKQLHGGDLNGQPANTSLLTSAQLTQITDTITNLLTAPKEQEPNGLNARLDRALRGENKQGGLYATEIKLESCVLGVVGCLFQADTYATLGGLLNPDVQRTNDVGVYESAPYDYYYVDGTLGVTLLGVIQPLLAGIGTIVEGLLFGSDDNPGGLLSGLLGDLQNDVVAPLLTALNPVLELVLSPIANIIINRQTLREVEHGSVFTVSALEVNVLDFATSTGEVLHLPLATASVMAQSGRLIDLDLDVARIGNGRDLYTGNYTYDVVCTADGWDGLEATGLVYDKEKVGEGFSYNQDEDRLDLTGVVSGGLTEPLRVMPGAECTVTANPAPASHDADKPADALRATPTDADGVPVSDAVRTPYTYFLDTENGVARVSGTTPADGSTEMTTEGVSWAPNDPARIINVDSDTVGEEWKTHSYTFVVPQEATDHRVSIVHAYDIDTRNIVVTKEAVGGAPEDEDYSFEYSLDGENWSSDPADLLENESFTIKDKGSFTIKDVPVLDPETLEPMTVMVREALGDNEAGPVVSWKLGEDGNALPSTYDAAHLHATTTFVSGPVATFPTPDTELRVTNSYLEVSVDKHIDGLFSNRFSDTTLLSFGADEMTIRYTVTTAHPDSVTLSDASLNNDLFTLPSHITVDPDTGVISGCTLTAVEGKENEYSCEFNVSFSDPEAPFHYKADEAEVTATVTVTVDGRDLTASDTDKHGAMRLSDILGMLPSTGATSLVLVLGLGLLIALAALINYIRNRRN